MFNRRTIAVIKRELKSKLFSKTFIIMTVLVPLFMLGILSIQYFIYSLSEEQKSNIIVFTDNEEIRQKLENELNKIDDLKSGMLHVNYELVQNDKFDSRLKELKPDILSEKITGLVFVPSTLLQAKGAEYYSSNPNNTALFNKIKPAINNALIDIYFSSRKLTSDEINFARKDVEIKGFRLTKENKVEEESIGNKIALFLFSFLLYMAIIFSGSMTLNSVVEEKSNKIVEVLLSSASSTELMTGKIVGTVIVEVIQMIIWLSPIFLLVTTSWFIIPSEFMPQMSLGYLGYFIINYTLALITYIALYATVGAIFDNPQDAQSGMWPVLMLIMIPFFIAIGLESNPQSTLAQVASIFPFASLIVMPARMILVDVPLWQILASLIVDVIVLIGVFKLAGKIYRIGILLSGKKPKWSEVFQWLRMST
ncbi:MAG TPA: ABC transporter permease [Ignavibacteriaceae bacterium]|nr:ABC transporter permease [Ignavibacteriaceae bacterium]